MDIRITKHDGTKIPFDASRINRSIERAAFGLSNPALLVMQIATETHLTMYDGITTDELDKATCKYASSRARFAPAKDGEGQPTTGSYSSRVKWVIPKD